MFTLKLERIHIVYPDARQSPTAVKLQVQPEQLQVFTKGTEHQDTSRIKGPQSTYAKKVLVMSLVAKDF